MEKRIAALAAAMFLGWGVNHSNATQILSDDFSYPDNPSLQAVWGPNATLDTGLSFGSLVTSGASLSLTDPNSGNQDAGITASRSLGSGADTYDSSHPTADPLYQSPIWSSYLIQPTSRLAVNDIYGDTGTTLGTFYSNSQGQQTELASYPASSRPYSNVGIQQFTADNNQSGTPSYTVSTGNTYLVISNLNLNGVETGGYYDPSVPVVTETHYLFTVTAFNNWVAAGKDPASIGSFAVSTASYDPYHDYGFETLDSTSLVNFQAYDGSADFGNLLVGTTLDDVTPVPEPATPAIWVATTLFFLSRRRRQTV